MAVDPPPAIDVPVEGDEPLCCPACGVPVQRPENPLERLVVCASCGNQFFLDDGEDDTDTIMDLPDLGADRADELDGLRIRQLVHLRRASFRARTYAIVALVGCAVVTVKLLLMAADHYKRAEWARGYQFGAIAVVAFIGMNYFGRQVAALHREAKARPSIESPAAPQFDALSDGSQRVKNLEEMQ